jgi:hypothetical protein
MAKYRVFENTANGYRERVKDGFNWPAFFFGPLWYLFNGMVAKGAGWLILAITVGSFTFGLGGIVVWIVAGAMTNGDLARKYLQGGWRFVGYEQDGTSTQPGNDAAHKG